MSLYSLVKCAYSPGRLLLGIRNNGRRLLDPRGCSCQCGSIPQALRPGPQVSRALGCGRRC